MTAPGLMLIAQFLFGLVLIILALAVLALTVGVACWLVLYVVRWLPLIGRRQRHAAWDALNLRRSDK